jgi:thymidylate synthase ThyX
MEQHFGEPPLTIVKDMEDALKIELMSVEGINDALLEHVTCGYHTKPLESSKESRTVGKILQELVTGGSLWQGMEAVHLKFKVTGCTRILTHQLVRQRIGITFSQQCSGEVDWRHADILMPRVHEHFCTDLVRRALGDKTVYAKAVDSKLVSIQEARYVLPQCLETFLYFDCSLVTAMALYSKRICTQAHYWEMVTFARKFKETILANLPELAIAFESPCEKHKCWYDHAKDKGQNVFLYRPDAEHDNYDWHPDTFIYDWTHQQISTSGTPIPTQYYVGIEMVDHDAYIKEWEKWQ